MPGMRPEGKHGASLKSLVAPPQGVAGMGGR